MPFELDPKTDNNSPEGKPSKNVWNLTIEPNGDPQAKGHEAPSIGVWLNKNPSKSVSEIVHRIYPHQNAGKTMFELSEQAQRWANGFAKGVKVSDPDVDLHVIGQSLKWDQEITPPALPTADAPITLEALQNALQPLEWSRVRDTNGKFYDDVYEAQTSGTIYQYEKVDDYWSIYVADPKGRSHETLYRVDHLVDEDAAIEAVDAHRISVIADQLGIPMPVEPAPELNKPASQPIMTSSPSM